MKADENIYITQENILLLVNHFNMYFQNFVLPILYPLKQTNKQKSKRESKYAERILTKLRRKMEATSHNLHAIRSAGNH